MEHKIEALVTSIISMSLAELSKLRLNDEFAQKLGFKSRFQMTQNFTKEKNFKLSDFVSRIKMQRMGEYLASGKDWKEFKSVTGHHQDYIVRLFTEWFLVHPKDYKP